MDPFENSHQKGCTTSAANSTWFFAPLTTACASRAGMGGRGGAVLRALGS